MLEKAKELFFLAKALTEMMEFKIDKGNLKHVTY